MTKDLFFQAIFKFFLGVLLVGALIFIPAGTLYYAAAWVFMGVLFIPMFIVGLVLMVKNPDLLRKRLQAKEQQKEQSLVIKLSGLMFLIGFIAAGLNFRFGWILLPRWVLYVGVALFLLSYACYGEVLRENAYLSRTIEVQKGQKVIDTGLYGIVRHPMYSATIVLFLSMPLILGSLITFILFLFYPFIIVLRIKGEEALLEKELDGYVAYKAKVPYRLLPFIW